MDPKERIAGFFKALPVAHRVGIAAAVVITLMAAVPFVRWITTPSYTVLYSGLDDQAVSAAVDELETLGVPYQLEAGGSRVMVPREQLYDTRAALASAGVAGRTAPSGYELLDDQGLSVSDFRQRVDYQRALEGELAKTLMAMDGVDDATVHLVIPEDELFEERQQPVKASVVLGANRTLGEDEVEAATFVVASAVDGLDIEQITVADTSGLVLHAPGDVGGSSGVSNRQMRQTRDFEKALANDVEALLTQASGGSPASVVVRAALNYDEQETEQETFDPEAAATLREQTTEERFEGTGPAPGGAVGVDGGPVEDAPGTESNYERDEAIREYGVDRLTTRTITAPGGVEQLSVAVVMDDGSFTGVDVPAMAVVEDLVAAAIGIDEERGDTIAVSARPFRAPEEPEAEPEESPIMALLPQILGALVLVVIAIALFLMSRRRSDVDVLDTVAHQQPIGELGGAETEQIDLDREPELEPAGANLRQDVSELVQRQPEEIATLLRGWLGDRRT